jgi:hypothetical protein
VSVDSGPPKGAIGKDTRSRNKSSAALTDPQATRGRGRPPGRNSLQGDFEVAAFVALHSVCRLKKYHAADLVAVLFVGEQLQVVDVDHLLSRFAVDLKYRAPKSWAGNLIKRASTAMTMQESHWVISSAVALAALLSAWKAPSSANRTMKLLLASSCLAAFGWNEELSRILRRISIAPVVLNSDVLLKSRAQRFLEQLHSEHHQSEEN